LEAGSGLQGIGCAEVVAGADVCGLLHHSGVEFHPAEIRSCEKGIETLKSSLIAASQGPDPAFQPAQATQA
jgi:hypothetical protein